MRTEKEPDIRVRGRESSRTEKVHWGRVHVQLTWPRILLVPRATVTEWPTWLPYSRCSYLCRKPTEAGQLSLESRSIALTLR